MVQALIRILLHKPKNTKVCRQRTEKGREGGSEGEGGGGGGEIERETA